MPPPERGDVLRRLVARAIDRPGYENLEPVVTKEIVHYDMLHALSKARLLDGLTFQGGTALRLCHGGRRLSEDLDFAGGADFDGSRLGPIKDALERHVGARYGLDVTSRSRAFATWARGVEVRRWTLSIDTDPGRPDLPRQRIKLEIANVPAHDGTAMAVRANYAGLPDGYDGMLVVTESAREIASDKVVSLVATARRFPRYRDLWDLTHLADRGAEADPQLVGPKVGDYAEDGFGERCAALLERLPELVHGGEFAEQMRRFLPSDVHAATFERADALGHVERTVRAQIEAGTRFDETSVPHGPNRAP